VNRYSLIVNREMRSFAIHGLRLTINGITVDFSSFCFIMGKRRLSSFAPIVGASEGCKIF
jgi:hypothetical protein